MEKVFPSTPLGEFPFEGKKGGKNPFLLPSPPLTLLRVRGIGEERGAEGEGEWGILLNVQKYQFIYLGFGLALRLQWLHLANTMLTNSNRKGMFKNEKEKHALFSDDGRTCSSAIVCF